MQNVEVAPINHGFGSATVTTAAEAGKSGVKGFVKGGLWTAAIFGTIGIATLAFASGGLAIAAGIASLVLAIPAGLYGAGIGSALGLATGTYHGINRVGKEQGAANVMQAQVAAYQAQAAAVANDNKYNFPAQGSPYNEAGTTVNAMQADGRVNGMQLQRA